MSQSFPPQPEKTPPPRGGRMPGVIVWAIVALALAALAVVQATDPVGDAAALNILTLILGFIAVAALFVWFVALSSYPRTLRILSAGTVALTVGLFFAAYKIEGVSGSLIPRFRLRFAAPRDALLGDATVAEITEVDLETTTAQDFPQFLGPQRNAVLPDVQLEHDWETHPPKLMWKQPIGAGWSGFAVVNGFAVTLEQRGPDELVTCYEVSSGKLRWSHAETGRHKTVLGGIGPRSTPTIHHGKVFTVTALGVLLCLRGEDGTPLWRIDLVEKFGSDRTTEAGEIAWGRANSPLIVDDLVVVPAGGPADKPVSLAAFRQADGELVWQAGKTQISYASPALATIGGLRQILSVNESTVSAHDPESGKLLWEADWPGDSSANASASQPQAVGGERVLLSKGYGVGGRLLEVSKAPGGYSTSIVWESNRVLKTKFTNAAVMGEHAYCLSDGILQCVDLATGETSWKGQRYGQGQILGVGDALLVMGENTGEVALVAADPAKFRELGAFPALEGQTWNTLCLAGDYLLVRNAQQAACYELALRRKATEREPEGAASP